MIETKVFCEECRNDVEYTTASVPMVGRIKGKEYQYIGSEARCMDCGSLLYVPELSDANLRSLYDVFRQENGIIPLEIIRAIPEKYAIGKRPLSLLLGWGEQTYSRYSDGNIPTRQYSDTLLRIYNEPQFYAELLEANKANLPSQHAYEKSRHAVDALLSSSNSSCSKINTVIQYILFKCEDITPLALQKALYYVQGFHYAFHRDFLFEEDCQAWVHGPVYEEVYDLFKDFKFNPIEDNRFAILKERFEELDDQEKMVIDLVINTFGKYSGKVLENITHNEDPWKDARSDYEPLQPSREIISKEEIKKYFSNVANSYGIDSEEKLNNYIQSYL